MSILLWITTEMEYKIKCYNRSVLLPRVVIKLTIKGLTWLTFLKYREYTEIVIHGRVVFIPR